MGTFVQYFPTVDENRFELSKIDLDELQSRNKPIKFDHKNVTPKLSTAHYVRVQTWLSRQLRLALCDLWLHLRRQYHYRLLPSQKTARFEKYRASLL